MCSNQRECYPTVTAPPPACGKRYKVTPKHILHTRNQPDVTRRQSIRSGLLVTAVALLESECLLSSSANAATDNLGLLRVSLSSLPGLQSINGSVILVVAGATPPLPPVVLTRTGNNTFACVTSICTHAGCTIHTFSSFNNSLDCNCHGSRFSAAGEVLNGPALTPLQSYPAQFDGQDVVTIQIPGLGFKIAGAMVSTAHGRRFRLVISTKAGRIYSVRFRNSPASQPTLVPFSPTQDGALQSLSVAGNGADVSVYVDTPGTQGFFSVWYD